MNLDELKRSLSKGALAPVWLVHGAELWTIEQAVNLILQAAVGTTQDPMLITRVDLSESKRGAGEVVGACRSIGLFTPTIAVVARAAEQLDKRAGERDEILRYLDNPVAEATLILKASTALDGRSALVKRIAKVGQVLTYPQLRTWDAEKWVKPRAAELGHTVDADTAKLVVELVGPDLLTLENTLQQLSLYVGPQRPITRETVEKALAATRSHSIFELTGAIAAKRPGEALRHLKAMLEQRESPVMIMSSIVRHFRQLVEAKAVVDRGGGVNEVQAAAQLHPFAAKQLTEQVTRFDAPFLRAAFEVLFRADVEIRTTRLDPQLRLENLIVGLCAPSSRRSA